MLFFGSEITRSVYAERERSGIKKNQPVLTEAPFQVTVVPIPEGLAF